MLRLLLCIAILITAAIPAFAHGHHAMHHWEDIRYLKEIHFQLVLIVAAGIALKLILHFHKRRNLI